MGRSENSFSQGVRGDGSFSQGFAWSGSGGGPDIWPGKLEAASVSCVLSAAFHEEQNFCCLAASAAWTHFLGTKIPT